MKREAELLTSDVHKSTEYTKIECGRKHFHAM